jgi:hypothetical protein
MKGMLTEQEFYDKCIEVIKKYEEVKGVISVPNKDFS